MICVENDPKRPRKPISYDGRSEIRLLCSRDRRVISGIVFMSVFSADIFRPFAQGASISSDLLTLRSAKCPVSASIREPAVAALDWGAGEGKPDMWWRTHREANPQARAGEACRCLVERLTEGLSGKRSVWGAERSQGDMQLAIGDADVACSGEQLMEQGSPLLIDTRVVRS